MGMGMQLAAAMVLFGGIGWYADGAWGTTPWLMVVGLVAGATGGMINLIRISTRGPSSK
jgi:F0F1-type ATP synthase assembly protein I